MLYFIGYILNTFLDFIYKFQKPQIVQYPAKVKLALMEEFSETIIYKGKPELGNSNVNADYFYSTAEVFFRNRYG